MTPATPLYCEILKLRVLTQSSTPILAATEAFIAEDEKLSANHQPGTAFDDDEWELYHVENDPNEINNLAEQYPEKLRELSESWKHAAWHNSVFPLDDRSSKLTNLRSFEVEINHSFHRSDQKVVVAHGDKGGGYIVFALNEYGKLHEVQAEKLSAGNHLIILRTRPLKDV